MPYIYTSRTGTGTNTGQTGTSGAGGGGGGILLPGLIGWALTGGPQQTLSSAGVIASGPLDYTNNGSLTFGSDGVILPTPAYPSTTYLSLANSALLDLEGLDWEIELMFKVPLASAVTYNELFTKGFGTLPSENDCFRFEETNNGNVLLYVVDGEASFAQVDSGAASCPRGQMNYVGAWYTAATKTLSLQANGGTVVSTVLSEGMINTDGPLFVGNDSYDDGCEGNVKSPRIWIGTQQASSRTWRRNGNAGRTDAEIAAYAG